MLLALQDLDNALSLRFSFVIEISKHLRDSEKCLVTKVIVNLGLCISVYDMRSIDCGFVFPRDGASILNVKFGFHTLSILFFDTSVFLTESNYFFSFYFSFLLMFGFTP